jgi:hypothetical protein
MGTSHFGEIAFVFYNLIGNGYQDFMNPFLNPGPGEVDLAKLTSRMWISFVSDLNPNNHERRSLALFLTQILTVDSGRYSRVAAVQCDGWVW